MIHEPFTPLPCVGAPGHRTTLQLEGCAEKQILRSDTQSNLVFEGGTDAGGGRDQRVFSARRDVVCLPAVLVSTTVSTRRFSR